MKRQGEKYKTGVAGLVSSITFLCLTVLIPLGRVLGGFLSYSESAIIIGGEKLTNSINYYWDVIRVSIPYEDVPDLSYQDYVDQGDLTAEIIWRIIPLWGWLWIALGVIGTVLIAIPAVQKVLDKEPSKIWKIGVVAGIFGTIIEYGLFIVAWFLEDWEEVLDINFFLIICFIIGWGAIVLAGMFINDDLLLKRMKEHTELILGLSLAVPVIVLYIYGLLLTPNQTYMLVSTALVILVFFVGSISLDLEVGSVGLPNFGKVAFFAIGAYVSTLLYNYFGVEFWISVVIALIVSSLFGYIISIPAVKLRADYFAIMTIAGGELIRLLLQYEKIWLWDPDTNTQTIGNRFTARMSTSYPFNKYLSDFGITILRDIGLGETFIWQIALLIAFIIISLLVYAFVQIIRKSPYGRTLRAIREDDITVTSVGKDVTRFRWQVTTVAAFLAGIAGVMYATTFNSLDATYFKPSLTFQLYMFIIIGGVGNSRGAFAGTALVTLFLRGSQVQEVQESISLTLDKDTDILGPFLEILQLDLDINPYNLRFVILGSILILFLLFKPAGLIPEPKTDNEKYMRLLTAEERRRSDEAIAARQSLTERERIDLEEIEKEPA